MNLPSQGLRRSNGDRAITCFEVHPLSGFPSVRKRDSAFLSDTVREMEAADWASLSDQELLERRISTLGLRLEGTALEPLIQQLYDELSAKGLVFHPPCHVGDEWFVPIGIPAIFVPFFLVHDRLRALERTMMLEVEGETPEWFMKLMRHEAGHAYMYAYQLDATRKNGRQCFGQTSREETPDTYRPRPFSRSYVMHLEDWYAQSHPDEDFAETFAVWLTPGLDWRKRYAGWLALQKLEYVDELMRSLAGRPPPAYARVSRRRLRLSQRQAQDVLRAQTKAQRRYVSQIFTMRICDSFSPRRPVSRRAHICDDEGGDY